MTFLGLIVQNLAARRLRSVLTALAVAIGVMAVLALGVLTFSLKTSATSILKLGAADATVAQKGDNLFDSTIPTSQAADIGALPGVLQATGVLAYLEKLDADHPQQVHLGIRSGDLPGMGVRVSAGRVYGDDAHEEVIVGARLAATLHKHVGDSIRLFVDTEVPKTYRIVGEFDVPGAASLVRSYGENAVMLPLPELQGVTQRGDTVTLVFVKIDPRTRVSALTRTLRRRFPALGAVTGASDYGLIDRNLALVEAANTGGTVLGAVIGIAGVLVTSLLSFLERVREFGVLRSIGWSRRRVLALVLGEALVVSLVGAAVGLLLGWVAVGVLQDLPSLKHLFQPVYPAHLFARALYFAGEVALVGAAYPALKAARLQPLEALSHE